MDKENDKLGCFIILFCIPLLIIFHRDEDTGKFDFYNSLLIAASYFFNIMLFLFVSNLFLFTIINIALSIVAYFSLDIMFALSNTVILLIILFGSYKVSKKNDVKITLSQAYFKIQQEFVEYFKTII